MGKRLDLDKLELLSKYPEYSNRKNVDIQRWTMFPIGVKSKHHGKQVTFTKAGAESIIKNVKDRPVMYADGTELPTSHSDKTGNRSMVGSSIGGGIYKDELGTEWAYTDILVYKDVNKKIYNDIIEHQDELGTSIEAYIDVDDDANIHSADYEGLSILSNDSSAWHTELLVADKGEATTVEVTYDEAIKKIIGENYTEALSARDTELEALKLELETKQSELELQLKEKEEQINGLNTENSSLRTLNTQFSNLIK